MGSISRGDLDALYTGYNAKLQEGFALADMGYQEFAMEIKSSTSIEEYFFNSLLSRMREWIGPRQVNQYLTKKLSVKNRDFEHTIEVDRNDLEDGGVQAGAKYDLDFVAMGSDSKYLWTRLVMEALVANGLWLDGSAFFLTNRKYNKSTICNKTTDALTSTSFEAAWKTMQKYADFNGNPLLVRPNLLIVGPDLEATAWDILENPHRYDATDKVQIANRNKNKAKILVRPELTGTYANYWFLLDATGPVRGVAVQKRKEGALVRRDSETDSCVFERNKNEYGLHNRGEGALVLPHLIYAGIVSA